MNRMKSVCFPVKGVGGLSLIFSRVFMAVDFFGHDIGIGFVICFKVSVSVSFLGAEVSGVSSIVESRSRGTGLSECQSFVVSVYRGVKVSECAVKILVRLLVSQHFCKTSKRLDKTFDSLNYQCLY
jgi:hypothetical protein